MSAREGARVFESKIKRSALYFDEALLPDPLFEISGRTRERERLPWVADESVRAPIAEAAASMHALTPLVQRLGRVRFVPCFR